MCIRDRRKNAKIYSVSVNAFQDVSTRLAAQEFGFWLDQIFLLNAKEGLLSEAPLAWPIFKSRISYEVISHLLGIMEIHDQIIRNAPNTKLWQIGEQLGLNPQAMPKVSDYPAYSRALGQPIQRHSYTKTPTLGPVSYTHLRSPRDRQKSRMPSSA